MKVISKYQGDRAHPRTFEVDTFDQVVVKHYLQHAEDVRKCPKSDCSYSGFIQEGFCKEQLQCKKCKTQWSDPAHQSSFKSFITEIKLLATLNSSHFTYLRNLLFEEPCPRCGVLIQKNGGCEHMACGRCKHEFCWFCLGPYYSYQHQDRSLACPYRYVAVVGVMIALLITWGAKIGYAWETAGYFIFKFYYYALVTFEIDVQIFVSACISYEVWWKNLLQIYNSWVRLRGPYFWGDNDRKRILAKSLAFMTLIVGVNLCLFYFYYYASTFTYSMVYMLMIQGLVIVGGFTCYVIYKAAEKALNFCYQRGKLMFCRKKHEKKA